MKLWPAKWLIDTAERKEEGGGRGGREREGERMRERKTKRKGEGEIERKGERGGK